MSIRSRIVSVCGSDGSFCTANSMTNAATPAAFGVTTVAPVVLFGSSPQAESPFLPMMLKLLVESIGGLNV